MKTIEELSELILGAAELGNAHDIKKLILAGADVNTKNCIGYTPLHLAICYNRIKVATILIESGANLSANDCEGGTPLHYAAHFNFTEASLILIKNGANVNFKNKDGSTPLHMACRRGKVEPAIELIKNGANLNSTDKQGHTPIEMAFDFICETGDKHAALALISYGANELFEAPGSIKTLTRKIKAFISCDKPFDEIEALKRLTAHQASAQGGFTERAIELLRDYPSRYPQDCAESLVILAKQHKKHDTAAAIQSFIATQAIDSMLGADAKARPLLVPGKS